MEILLSKPGYQVLIYDLPGYGQSQSYSHGVLLKAGFQGDTSVKFQAKALAALIQHVHLSSPPAVVAHDIAGSIVLRTHLLERVPFASMLLLDTNTVLPWGDGFYKLVRSTPEPFLQLPGPIFEAAVRAVTQSACHNPLVLQSGWEDLIVQPWIGSAEAQNSFVRQIAQADDGDVREMLEGGVGYADVQCDVKVMMGEQDQWIPREKVEDLVRQLGKRAKEFVVVPEAGHLVMLDQPARVAVEVCEWLAKY